MRLKAEGRRFDPAPDHQSHQPERPGGILRPGRLTATASIA